jgi:SSS family solute:Na+ symporter
VLLADHTIRKNVKASGGDPDRLRSRPLELAVAVTGVIATMPYIALQLIGMAAAIKALGLAGELPLIAAFVILALYTYSSGLRAPALIAFVKDAMIYVAVIAAVALIPGKLGGTPRCSGPPMKRSASKARAAFCSRPTNTSPTRRLRWDRRWRLSCIRTR